jgi:hypothetical protein
MMANNSHQTDSKPAMKKNDLQIRVGDLLVEVPGTETFEQFRVSFVVGKSKFYYLIKCPIKAGIIEFSKKATHNEIKEKKLLHVARK